VPLLVKQVHFLLALSRISSRMEQLLCFLFAVAKHTPYSYAQSQLIPAIFANQIHAGTFVRLVLKTLKPAHLLLIPAFCLKSSCSS
jgi:hypothetical protein